MFIYIFFYIHIFLTLSPPTHTVAQSHSIYKLLAYTA